MLLRLLMLLLFLLRLLMLRWRLWYWELMWFGLFVRRGADLLLVAHALEAEVPVAGLGLGLLSRLILPRIVA